VCVPLPRQVLNVNVGRGALSLEVLREGGKAGGKVKRGERLWINGEKVGKKAFYLPF